MEWISVRDMIPAAVFDGFDEANSNCVLITDGELIAIGMYIHIPKEYGCVDDDDEREDCVENPHWHVGETFLNAGRVFGIIEPCQITHWMHLPKAPND